MLNQNNLVMKKTIQITVDQLVEMLKNWNYGAQPVSIQYATTPRLTKEGKAKFGQVTKLANIGAMVGYSYENSVNNQREREHQLKDFMSQPLWKGKGKRLSTALSTHTEKGKFYLTYKKQTTFRSFHFDQTLQYVANEVIKAFFPQSDYSHQGLNKPVYHREIAVENVKKLKFRKTTYVVVPA